MRGLAIVDASEEREALKTTIEEVPVTSEHAVPRDLDAYVRCPGVARATEAASRERPRGQPPVATSRTALQQHCDYFDMDKDGRIGPIEAITALRYLHLARWEPMNTLLALLVWFVYNGTFFFPSQDSWFPNPLLIINTRNLHRCKHGSNSKTWDHEGRYIPERYEEIFSKYDSSAKGVLSLWDVARLVKGQSNLFDAVGILETIAEWLLTWWVFHDERGLLHREDVRGIFDGSSFYRLAERNGYKHYGLEARRAAIAKGMS